MDPLRALFACTLLAALMVCAVTSAPLNTTLPTPTPTKSSLLPSNLFGTSNEYQKKHLNPQLVGYFLRPFVSYLSALAAAAQPSLGNAALDDGDADYGYNGGAAQLPPPTLFAQPWSSLTLPVPPKLSLLASFFGLGGAQPGSGASGVANPSYQRDNADAAASNREG